RSCRSKRFTGAGRSVQEVLVQDDAEVPGDGAQVIVGDGLADQPAAHRQHLDVDLGALFDGVGQAEGGVKVGARDEQPVLGPDGRLVVLHLLAGGHGDAGPARHHPGADAHPFGEHHRALGSALPQRAGEVPVGQGQDIGQGNDVGGVTVVDDPVGPAGGRLADAVVHKVAGELAGGLCAARQAPDDAPAVARRVDLHDADAVLEVKLHVAEIRARAGGDEVFPGQVFRLHAHLYPGAGNCVEEGAAGRHLLVLHAIGQVAAVALVPALQPAVGAHTDITLDDLNIQNAHFVYLSYNNIDRVSGASARLLFAFFVALSGAADGRPCSPLRRFAPAPPQGEPSVRTSIRANGAVRQSSKQARLTTS